MMLLWIVFATMAALAVAAILRPLLAARQPSPERTAHEAAVGRDQLEELERDMERGLISKEEAGEARVEIARRLIATNEMAATPATEADWRRPAAVFVVAAVPAIALGAYLMTGSPGLPAQPFAARQAEPIENQDLATLIGRVERHLQENPRDASGWEVVGPAYMRLRRFADAADAFRRAITLGRETGDVLASYGEARVFAAGGMIDAGARQAFERAVALDGTLFRPRYYLGLAGVQDGDVPGAIAIWEEMVASAPEGAPWLGEVNRQLAAARRYVETGGAEDGVAGGEDHLPGPTAEDVAAAEQLSAGERGQMIEGMVSGLAQRLDEEGGSVDEWVRLARAYVVLGRRDDALDVVARAREAYSDEPDELERLDEAAGSLGLGS